MLVAPCSKIPWKHSDEKSPTHEHWSLSPYVTSMHFNKSFCMCVSASERIDASLGPESAMTRSKGY